MMTRTYRRRSRQGELGMTIVEIMVVTGIVSILLTLAIPTWLAYRGRAARAEAKTHLAAIRTVLETYHANHDTYVDDLRLLGFAPEGRPRYLYGFTSDAVPAASGRNDSSEISGSFNKVNMVSANGLPLTEGDLPPSVVTAADYTIGAVGNIDMDADLDQLTLTSDGAMTVVFDDADL